MHKKVEESSIQYSRSWHGCLCACASHTALDCYSNIPELGVLVSSPDMWAWTRMHALVVMYRWTLCENVDSAKIKVPFYTTDINVLHVALMHRIVISIHIDESLHPYWAVQLYRHFNAFVRRDRENVVHYNTFYTANHNCYKEAQSHIIHH